MQALRTDGGVTGPDGRLMYKLDKAPGVNSMSRSSGLSEPPKTFGYSDEELQDRYARGEITMEQMQELRNRRYSVKAMQDEKRENDRLESLRNQFRMRQPQPQTSLSSAMRSV